ncbi:peptide ABC transporter substrate-binding protein [Catellatospora sp. TT07R-123]|uniref:ABC transporter substrate-binding protein n=1 Tax=Catellatospora sp. TT07R-123 TaxID=2733863 RepID=UPI001B2999E9|nr:ABC transporter substrate-binding protein [Catellatospora sp. TT07R-123]GHJ46522.1 peptide ABC transporter substrate-binding protein [Catellatospora sp. TT07R-123]
MIKKARALAATTAVLALALGAAACSSKKDETPGTAAPKPAFNAGVGAVYNPSDKKGGTLTFAASQDWDSVDPGDTYYGLSWNFLRTYGRSLVMFAPAPGAAGTKLVGDLAEGLGVPSDGGKTWTYKLRAGLKYEDGTAIKSADVKYAVLRSLDKEVLVNGPTYFNDWLALEDGYKGPYKSKGVDTKAIETPDDLTIVFHLNKPYGGFDYFAMQPSTVPVPEAKDTGAKYKEHVISSGPYMFDTYEAGKGFTLKRNPEWSAATDPNRKALPDRYEVKLGLNANDIDNQLISGDLQVDIAGTGVQAATLSKVLSTPDLKARADNPSIPRLWYTSINPMVKPFDNIECRKAVMYAVDKVGYQNAYNGEFAGGAIATSMLPPQVPGHLTEDLYPNGADHKGDLDKAKAALTACGKPTGFDANMAYRSDRPKEKATAEALQQSLARVGIKLTLKGYPTGDYFALYAGKPGFRNGEAQLGLATNGWGADWNDGFGFLQQIVDSRVIRDSGGSSNLSVMSPEVDALIDAAFNETDQAKRDALWGQVDKKVMENAVILPGVWAKALTLRGKNATNVFINESFGQYDYLSMGVQQ